MLKFYMYFVLKFANCKRPSVNFISLNWHGYTQITVILEYDKSNSKRRRYEK